MDKTNNINTNDHDLRKTICSDHTPSRAFSSLISTEKNHSACHNQFYGPYAHIRETLDHTYHSNYTEDRQRLQNSIIGNMLEDVFITDVNGNICSTPTTPWIVFTAGGKGHTVSFLVEKGLFPIQGFVVIDPDEIRRRFPEYQFYVHHSPALAGELTRKEAGYVVEILTAAALQAGKNALVDGSLRDWKWYKGYFDQLRIEYDNLDIAILHIIAPREAIFKRAMDRAKLTGRVVPREILEMAMEEVPKSVSILSPLADYFCELNNEPSKSIEIVTEGITWESFESKWYQTCAWVPPSIRKMKRASIQFASAMNLTKSFLRPVESSITLGRHSQQQSRSMFSALLCTEGNYRSTDGDNSHNFYGSYSHIRKRLDYNFHCNYIKERQWLQDSIIEGILKSPVVTSTTKPDNSQDTITTFIADNPWLVFVVGCTSVGKSHSIRELIKKERLTLRSFIYANINSIKLHLPEAMLYASTNNTTTEDENGIDGIQNLDEATFKESLYIQDILIRATLQSGQNLIVNVMPNTIEQYVSIVFLNMIKIDFPMYRIALIHIVAPLDDLFQFTKDQAEGNNRGFSKTNTLNEIQVIDQIIPDAIPQVDFYSKLLNPLLNSSKKDNQNGRSSSIQILLPNDITWDDFRKNWDQSCSWVTRVNKITEVEA